MQLRKRRKQRRHDRRQSSDYQFRGFSRDESWWHPAFERLEDRRMLASIPYNTIAAQLQPVLNAAQTSLTNVLNQYKPGDNASVPFLGTNLGDAAQFVPQLLPALSTLASTDGSTSVLDAFSHAFGPLLVDDGNATPGNSADVHLVGSVGSDGSFQAYMRLHVVLNPTNRFSTGLPALPLQLAGSALDFAVNSYVDYELAIAYSAASNSTTLIGGHPLLGTLPGKTHEFALRSYANLPTSISGTATLGFVQGTFGIAQSPTSSIDVTATADNFETPNSVSRGPVVFTADAYLQFTGGITGVPAAQAFPTISTTIHLNWDNSSGNGGAPHIEFDDVTVNLGQFLHNVLGPVLSDIESVTAHIKPAIDVLTKSLPVLSDISHVIGGGDVSLLSITSIAASYAGLGPLGSLFSNIVTFLGDFGSFDPSLGAIDFGSFNLDAFNVQNVMQNAGDPLDLANKTLTSFDFSNLPDNADAFNSAVDHLPVSVSDQVKSSLHKLVSSLYGDPNGLDFEFPIFKNPGKAIFNMLMGRDSDLFTLKGKLAVDAAESTGADLFGMGLSFDGAVHLAGQLTFAYDTYGLRELTRDGSNNIAHDILDGFYIKTDSNLQFGGTIGISAGLSAGIAHATVTGSVGTPDGNPISATINTSYDADHDGKLRFHEFPSDPLDAFSVSGEIDAGLTFHIGIGVNTPLGFVGYEKDFDIAHTVVFPFSQPPPPPEVTLASPANGPGSPQNGSGVVLLYAGKEAIRRIGVDDHDGGPDGRGESYVIKHLGDDSTGETIEIDAFDKAQTITGVKTIWANGDVGDLTVNVMPGVEANVVVNNAPDPLDTTYTGPYTNRGHAYLTYSGTGTARLTAGQLDSTLSGGPGTSFLYGGAANDTFVTGQGTSFISDDAGDNLIIDQAPSGDITLSSSSSAYNTLKVIAGTGTTSISETPDGAYLLSQIQNSSGHSSYDHLAYVSRLIIDAQANAVAINIGDLEFIGSRLGSVAVYLNAASSARRSISVDTPTPTPGSPVLLNLTDGIDPNVSGSTAHGVSIDQNSIGGTEVTVLGLTGADTLTVKQHGGTTSFGSLGFTGGTIILDNSNEQSDVATTITTPVQALGSTITTNFYYGYQVFDAFRVQAQGDPDIVFTGLNAADSVTLNVSAAPLGQANQVNVDASTLIGTLNVRPAGATLLVDNVLVSAVNDGSTVAVDGGNTDTSVTIGAGTLEPIYGNVSVAHAYVTIDNSAGTEANILTLAGPTFAGWDRGQSITPPVLTLTGNRSLTIDAGMADQFDIESTPTGTDQITIQNFLSIRNLVSVVGAATSLVFNGDFEVLLGIRLQVDGSLQDLHRLDLLANASVLFNFSSYHQSDQSPTLVELADSGGQAFSVGGNGNFVISDQTYGLGVTINGYRSQDGLVIEVPGGSVDANLTQTSPGALSLDGSQRLLGTNVSAPLSVTIHARPGAVFMMPTGPVSASLPLFNRVNLLGSMPQDTLHVYDSTNNLAIDNDPILAPYAQFAASGGDPTTVTAGQPFNFAVIAEDANSATLANYSNQVQWFAYNRVTGDYFSSDYQQFTPADQGQHVFHNLVLPVAGTYKLGFDDGWNASSFTINVVNPPQASGGSRSDVSNAAPSEQATDSALTAPAAASNGVGDQPEPLPGRPAGGDSTRDVPEAAVMPSSSATGDSSLNGYSFTSADTAPPPAQNPLRPDVIPTVDQSASDTAILGDAMSSGESMATLADRSQPGASTATGAAEESVLAVPELTSKIPAVDTRIAFREPLATVTNSSNQTAVDPKRANGAFLDTVFADWPQRPRVSATQLDDPAVVSQREPAQTSGSLRVSSATAGVALSDVEWSASRTSSPLSLPIATGAIDSYFDLLDDDVPSKLKTSSDGGNDPFWPTGNSSEC
jgi:hypothetical protein